MTKIPPRCFLGGTCRRELLSSARKFPSRVWTCAEAPFSSGEEWSVWNELRIYTE